MPPGGRRPGAGRPKGSKSRPKPLLAARLRARLRRLKRHEDARVFAADWLREAEPEILRRVMASSDLKAQVAVWQEMRRYAFGHPVARLEVETGPSPLAVLQEILRERQRREAISAAAVSEPLALPPATEPNPTDGRTQSAHTAPEVSPAQ